MFSFNFLANNYHKNTKDYRVSQKKTPGYVQRLITQVWEQLLGHVGPFLDSSGSQLLFEPKKSKILYMELRENHILRELP